MKQSTRKIPRAKIAAGVGNIEAPPAKAARNEADDRAYNRYLLKMRARAALILLDSTQFVYMTDAGNMFATYLAALDPANQQHHRCNTCRQFIEKYGGLVSVNENGDHFPLLWDEQQAPQEIAGGVAALESLVARANITHVFHSEAIQWGNAITGEWTHMAITPPNPWKNSVRTAHQAMAEKTEDFKNVRAALNTFTPAVLDQALAILNADALYRGEKIIAQAEWLRELHELLAIKNQKRSYNLLWTKVAAAPPGFCHPRSSMLGTLLDDIALGAFSLQDIKRRFADKMRPDLYQRPQSAPAARHIARAAALHAHLRAAGNIARAEEIISKLSASGALARRYARLDEVEAFWRPPALKPLPSVGTSGPGVFGHLLAKEAMSQGNRAMAPPVTMTFDKFVRTVLSEAISIDYLVPAVGNFCAFVTAYNPAAPPILQWDSDRRRNPMSTYVYVKGSPAANWHLEAGLWRRVSALCYQPSMLSGVFLQHGQGAHFLLEGARDKSHLACGLALFPEILKSDFHEIRQTIEAFSKAGRISGYEDSSACGVAFKNGGPWSAGMSTFRVTTERSVGNYILDRWD